MVRAWIAVCVAVLLSGCTAPWGPLNEPNDFRWTGAVEGSETVDYQWRNDASGAVVEWSGRVDSGMVAFSIEDENGTFVGTWVIEGGSEPFTEIVGPHEPGLWSILIAWQSFRGEMDLRVRAR